MTTRTHTALRHSAGFTLIELLVVMGIIGILAALLFANFSGARERARDTKRKNDLTEIKNALRLYYNDFGKYPADTGGSTPAISGCGNVVYALQTKCNWNASFSDGSTIYMNSLPNDPLYDATTNPNTTYIYSVGPISGGGNSDHFVIHTFLENASDPSSTTSQQQCGSPAPYTAKLYMICD